jgi:hypothetical protein
MMMIYGEDERAALAVVFSALVLALVLASRGLCLVSPAASSPLAKKTKKLTPSKKPKTKTNQNQNKTQVDPLVSLMKVEKVPDSTYDVIGGLDQQIKEIKEVIELPLKVRGKRGERREREKREEKERGKREGRFLFSSWFFGGLFLCSFLLCCLRPGAGRERGRVFVCASLLPGLSLAVSFGSHVSLSPPENKNTLPPKKKTLSPK